MNHNADWIVRRRLQCQMLQPLAEDSIEHVVARLGGIQAQDSRWTPWIAGVRSKGSTAADLAAAIEQGRIVKSWLFRGTLHLVAEEDLAWLTQVVAPVVIKGNARRYRQLELTDRDFATAERLLSEALSHTSHLTRNEARQVLERGGLSSEGQRLPYMLQRASLDGLLRHGADEKREPTFVFRERPGNGRSTMEIRDELIRRLAHRYLSSHGPATRADLLWWSGIPAKEITAALTALIEDREVFRDERRGLYWVEQGAPIEAAESLIFLAPFDEYVVGYEDRSVVLDTSYATRVNAGGGMIRPTLVDNGRIVGVWSYRDAKEGPLVSPMYFDDHGTLSRSSMDGAIERLSLFFGKDVRII